MTTQQLIQNYEKRIEELNISLKDHTKDFVSKPYDMVSFIDATIIQMRKTIEDLKHITQ